MKTDIYFYIPREHWPDPLPGPDNPTWTGYSEGIYCWTLQTYYLLKKHGVECHLTQELPKRGVIIAHRGLLPDSLKPRYGQYLICIQADWSRHPFAYDHIAQNLAQTKQTGVPKLMRYFRPGVTHFVRLWAQAGITPRDAHRPKQLRSLSYFGLDLNLAEELKSADWHNFLADLGIRWNVVTQRDRWGDYSETDATLFVRDFKGQKHTNKPATKLYNAWIANTLPICTEESAYLDEIDGPQQAVVIESYEDLKQQVRTIANKPELFAQYLQQGAIKAPHYTNAAIAAQWQSILDCYENFPISRSDYVTFMIARHMAYYLDKTLRRILKR